MEEDKLIILHNLASLNREVEFILKNRRDFLDEHMHMFSPFKVGDIVKNTETGEITKVISLYRYWTCVNELYDTSFNVYHKLENGDNTASYGHNHPYVKIDYGDV